MLNSKKEERVKAAGSIEYLELVGSMSTSNTNAILSALMQPWFGLIMISDLTMAMLVQHIVSDALQWGMCETEVISNPLTDSNCPKITGSMAVAAWPKLLAAWQYARQNGNRSRACTSGRSTSESLDSEHKYTL